MYLKKNRWKLLIMMKNNACFVKLKIKNWQRSILLYWVNKRKIKVENPLQIFKNLYKLNYFAQIY